MINSDNKGYNNHNYIHAFSLVVKQNVRLLSYLFLS